MGTDQEGTLATHGLVQGQGPDRVLAALSDAEVAGGTLVIGEEEGILRTVAHRADREAGARVETVIRLGEVGGATSLHGQKGNRILGAQVHI